MKLVALLPTLMRVAYGVTIGLYGSADCSTTVGESCTNIGYEDCCGTLNDLWDSVAAALVDTTYVSGAQLSAYAQTNTACGNLVESVAMNSGQDSYVCIDGGVSSSLTDGLVSAPGSRQRSVAVGRTVVPNAYVALHNDIMYSVLKDSPAGRQYETLSAASERKDFLISHAHEIAAVQAYY